MTYFSRDVFASIANLADKRAKKQKTCIDCGALHSSRVSIRCRPCQDERRLANSRAYHKRRRAAAKAIA